MKINTTQPVIHYLEKTNIWVLGHEPVTFAEARKVWDKTGSAIWTQRAHEEMSRLVLCHVVAESVIRWFDVVKNPPGENISYLIGDNQVCWGEGYLDGGRWFYPGHTEVCKPITRYANLPDDWH